VTRLQPIGNRNQNSLLNSQDYNFVCTGIDDNFLWPWMVSIFSASIHSQRRMKVGLGVIRGNFSPQNLEVVQDFCKVLNIDLVFKEFVFDSEVKLSTRIGREGYIRILWMDELDEQFLWLDSDTLALPGWDEIYSYLGTEENEPTICAVADKKVIARREEFPQNTAYQKAADSYFNSGVFLANPLAWKKNKYNVIWKNVGASFRELGFIHHDQDILNYVVRNDDRRLVHGKFNVIVNHPTQIEQSILHFAGGPKPWHLDDTSLKYFSAIENLKVKGSQEGAFSGKNWLFEFENYKRHEEQLLISLIQEKDLQVTLLAIRSKATQSLMKRNDRFKLRFLEIVGRKWF